jgi:hypothetical protein
MGAVQIASEPDIDLEDPKPDVAHFRKTFALNAGFEAVHKVSILSAIPG